MIRTKYLVIAVCACVAIVLSVGMWSITSGMSASQIEAREEVLFATPQDVYNVAPQHAVDRNPEREAFIAKVRTALRNQPVQHETIETPVVPSTMVVTEEVVAETEIESEVEVVSTQTLTPTSTATVTQSTVPLIAP